MIKYLEIVFSASERYMGDRLGGCSLYSNKSQTPIDCIWQEKVRD